MQIVRRHLSVEFAGDIRGLRALEESHKVRHALVVCLENQPRTVEGIQVVPWQVFLERLWGGELVR